MKTKRALQVLFLVLLVFFAWTGAYAQPVAAPNAFDRFMEKTLGGGKQSVGFGKDGTPTINQGVPTVNTDGGLPRVDVGGSIRNPSGQLVPVTNTGRIPAAEIGKAVGRATVNAGIKFAGVVGVGLVIYDLAKELGVILSKNPDGSLKYEKQDPNVCSTAPCYYYYDTSLPLNRYSSLQAACTGAAITKFGAGSTGVLNPSPSCNYYRPNGSWAGSGSISTATAEPSPPSLIPSTYQELVDKVAAKSGWPSGSHVRRLLAEDYPAPADRVQPIAQTVSGPATSPGKQATTTNTTNNTTKTETTTHNHTYNTNVVTTTSTTVTNIYNPATNTTETETKLEEPNPEPDNDAEDTLLPDQPKLYEPKYPQGLVGVWDAKKAALLATPLASVLPQLMPSVGSGGSCPSWMINLSLGSWDYGSHDVAPPCFIWDLCKFFIIAGALLLARALIFGG